MSKRSTHHATFVIERDYAASRARMFAAWAEPKAKGTRDLLDNLDKELQRHG